MKVCHLRRGHLRVAVHALFPLGERTKVGRLTEDGLMLGSGHPELEREPLASLFPPVAVKEYHHLGPSCEVRWLQPQLWLRLQKSRMAVAACKIAVMWG